jgi:hypothetical protein
MGQFDKLINHMERKLECLCRANDKPKCIEPLNVTKRGVKGELKVVKLKDSKKRANK